MSEKPLSDELREMHQELSEVLEKHQQLDPDTLHKLRQVAEDIRAVLATHLPADAGLPGSGPTAGEITRSPSNVGGLDEAESEDPGELAGSGELDDDGGENENGRSHSLPQTLQDLADDFSAEHPQLADMLNRFGYLLGNLGI